MSKKRKESSQKWSGQFLSGTRNGIIYGGLCDYDKIEEIRKFHEKYDLILRAIPAEGVYKKNKIYVGFITIDLPEKKQGKKATVFYKDFPGSFKLERLNHIKVLE